MTKDEALKLALEALEYFSDTATLNMDKAFSEDAITAIKEALAQPEQEPVGDFYITKDMAEHIKKLEVDWTICASGSKRPTEKKVVPVFVGNTTPPQRTWVGLTDDELFKIWMGAPSETEDRFAFVKAVIVKLKELNT